MPEADLVWPRPASTAEVAAWRQEQINARAVQIGDFEEQQANARWISTVLRQAEVPRLLAQKPEPIAETLSYHGRPLAEVLRNEAVLGTNQITLGEMLTLKPIITGAEPETITFAVPMRYDVLTNIGSLYLLIDVCTNGDSEEGCGVGVMECKAATNGDCLVTWSTLYETPGQHALQLMLNVYELSRYKQDTLGTMFPFVVTNLCQFSVGSAMYNPASGAIIHAKLPEPKGLYSIELTTVNGDHLKTITGATSNGVINIFWNLVDDRNHRLEGETFNSAFQVTLPDSGRSQTFRGP